MRKVTEIKNVHILKIASSHHGVPLLTGNLDRLLQMDKDALIQLFSKNKEKVVGIFSISMQLSGIRETLLYFLKDVVRVLKKIRR